ncbi:MAG: phosphopantetheine-binding protein [Verrucomicrobiota bacterium]|jgi:acyl carrier protein
MAALLMDMNGTLKRDIKQMMVENLMLQITAGEISDDQALFGPGSLGLDSVDALQLVVALDKNYGLKIPTPERAREVLESVSSMADAVAKHLASASVEGQTADVA